MKNEEKNVRLNLLPLDHLREITRKHSMMTQEGSCFVRPASQILRCHVLHIPLSINLLAKAKRRSSWKELSLKLCNKTSWQRHDVFHLSREIEPLSITN